MKTTAIPFLLILMTGALSPERAWTTEEPAGPLDDHPEWVACESPAECVSVKMGCYYWQPLNKAYVDKVPTPDCLKSIAPGPQPTVGCVDRQCVNNPFTVKSWGELEPAQRFQLVEERVSACRAAENPSIAASADTSQTAEYEALLDKKIRAHAFHDDELLTEAVKNVVPCETLAAWENGQEKWKTSQAKDPPGRRVTVERVWPPYSLDAVYPTLILYARVLQKCAASNSGRNSLGKDWWGDFHVDFTITPSGEVDPENFKPLYPGVAYMKPFMECASSAFKGLRFSPSPKEAPVKVSASIHFPYRNPEGTDSTK